MNRTLLALCTLALAAAPVAAGPIYLPAAIHETDGAYVRATELWVTNPDVLDQGFVVRYISTNVDGTARADGDEVGPYYIAPGESKRYADLVPDGFRGMLELDGAAVLQFNGSLTVRNSDGTIVGEAEVPVLTQADLAPAGSSLTLQAWVRSGSTLTTNFGIVNAGHAAAHCTVTVRQKSGLLIIQNVGINLSPLTTAQFDDALATLGQTTVLQGARSDVSCDQSFWTYISTYDDQTGAVELIEPSTLLASSTLTKPVGEDPEPPPGNSVVFTRSGEFARYSASPSGPTYRFEMPFNGTRQFYKVTLDFDVHVGTWDHRKPNGLHMYLWLNNGPYWSNMFGYINARGAGGGTAFRVNNRGPGLGQANETAGGSAQAGGDYHVHYEYDLSNDRVLYRLTTLGGSMVSNNQFTVHGSTFSTNRFFADFGNSQTSAGPESLTPGWAFSNLRAVFYP